MQYLYRNFELDLKFDHFCSLKYFFIENKKLMRLFIVLLLGG